MNKLPFWRLALLASMGSGCAVWDGSIELGSPDAAPPFSCIGELFRETDPEGVAGLCPEDWCDTSSAVGAVAQGVTVDFEWVVYAEVKEPGVEPKLVSSVPDVAEVSQVGFATSPPTGSGDPACASPKQSLLGTLRALREGTTVLSIVVGEQVWDTLTVKVAPMAALHLRTPAPGEDLSKRGITLRFEEEPFQVQVVATAAAGMELALGDATITWSVDDEKVASIEPRDDYVTLTPEHQGKTQLQVKVGSLSQTAPILVEAPVHSKLPDAGAGPDATAPFDGGRIPDAAAATDAAAPDPASATGLRP